MAGHGVARHGVAMTATIAPPVSPRLGGNLAAILSVALWASAFPATEVLLREWHPLLLAPVRLLLGGATLLVVVLASGAWTELMTAPWRRAAIIGASGIGGSVLCLVTGQSLTTAVSAAIVAAMQPVVAAMLGLGDRERLSGRLIVAIALATIGGAIASWHPAGGGLDLGLGDLLVLLSIVLWTWSSRAIHRELPAFSDAVRGAVTMLGGALALTFVASFGLALGVVPLRVTLTGWSPVLLLWIGTMAVGASFALWLTAMRSLGVTIASIHQNLVPFYVMLVMLPFGRLPETRELLGAACVLAGAIVAQRRPAAGVAGRAN